MKKQTAKSIQPEQMNIRIPTKVIRLMKADAKKTGRSLKSVALAAFGYFYRWESAIRFPEINRASPKGSGRKLK